MLQIAKEKLTTLSNIEYIQSDLLEYFSSLQVSFDSVISTYAIHHLTEEEKYILFEKIWASLKPGGKAIFGDLMFENNSSMNKSFEHYRSSNQDDLVKDIEDEFFWFIDSAVEKLKSIGFDIEVKKFSDLSWGIMATKPN